MQPQAAGRELLPAKCRTSISTPVPSARRAKKSGAWRLAFPDSLTQCSRIGWDATASTPGSASSAISTSRSTHDS